MKDNLAYILLARFGQFLKMKIKAKISRRFYEYLFGGPDKGGGVC